MNKKLQVLDNKKNILFLNRMGLQLRAILFVLMVLPFMGQAQESDLGNWLIYIGNKKLKSNWNIHNEIQYRNYNAIGDLEQLLIRVGAGYTFNDNKSNFLLGYGYILSENYTSTTGDKTAVNEHRIFQQFTSKQAVGKLTMNHRYRFEQRFVEEEFKLRFRYFLGLSYPLTNKESNNFYLSVYNEIFLNTKSSIFDRNRLYGGLGFKPKDTLKFELGYMNQFFENNGRDQINVIAFVTF